MMTKNTIMTRKMSKMRNKRSRHVFFSFYLFIFILRVCRISLVGPMQSVPFVYGVSVKCNPIANGWSRKYLLFSHKRICFGKFILFCVIYVFCP